MRRGGHWRCGLCHRLRLWLQFGFGHYFRCNFNLYFRHRGKLARSHDFCVGEELGRFLRYRGDVHVLYGRFVHRYRLGLKYSLHHLVVLGLYDRVRLWIYRRRVRK
ncbi:hypothetical protein CSC66_05455 [Pseudoxanthomonas kaohsiungensis]|nr:hypothetical protein CSC66_05455 [Pseudoxanthomonas kaohsiungensis]THD00537.1 hypothetical protein B1810_24425 [Panacagrimonas perspica]